MEKVVKISVIVCTYNTSWKNLKQTLDSIICQKMDGYEVIVCDDGSKENHKNQIEQYFAEHDFERYKLIMNPENNGTVQNMLSGVVIAKGKYVKPIGAGDTLTNSLVLDNVCKVMDENNIECLFTDMKIFYMKNGEIVSMPQISIPLKKEQYLGNDCMDKMLENIIVFDDHICGASMFYDRKLFWEMLDKLSPYVRYMEDVMQYLILLDGKPIYYFNNTCIAYECGSGISNAKTLDSAKRMLKDKNSFLDYLFKSYAKHPFVIRRQRIEMLERTCKNKFLKGIKKAMLEPKWLYFRINRR